MFNLLSFLFISFFSNTYSETAIHNQCDTISRSTFYKIANDAYMSMKKGDTSENSIIAIIKVYNTFEIDGIVVSSGDSALCKSYQKYFFKHYFPKFEEHMGIGYGIGMTLISRKFDLYIGSSGKMRCRDIYLLSDIPEFLELLKEVLSGASLLKHDWHQFDLS